MSSTQRHFAGKGRYFYGSDTISIAAIAAEGYADYDITDANAVVGDVVSVSLAEADMEALAMVISGSWVAADGTITVRIYNGTVAAGSSLTGGSATVYYTLSN